MSKTASISEFQTLRNAYLKFSRDQITRKELDSAKDKFVGKSKKRSIVANRLFKSKRATFTKYNSGGKKAPAKGAVKFSGIGIRNKQFKELALALESGKTSLETILDNHNLSKAAKAKLQEIASAKGDTNG